MGKFLRYIAIGLFGCLAYANPAFALDYYWYIAGNGVHSNTPTEACTVYGAMSYTTVNVMFSSASSSAGTSNYASCFITATNSSGTPFTFQSGTAQRYGDSCAVGTTWDLIARGCLAPVVVPPAPTYTPGQMCQDQTGMQPGNPKIWDATVSACVRLSESEGDAPCKYVASGGNQAKALTVAGIINSTGNAVAPPTFVDSAMKCQLATISSSECTIKVGGAISCNVLANFTGLASSVGDEHVFEALCSTESPCPPKVPEVTTKDEPCVPSANGQGGTSCTTTKETVSEGKQDCGLVNGAYKCYTKLPSSNGIITQISSSSKTLANGSVEVTVVKDSANMVCTDVNKCTTTHSTTTTKSTTSQSGGSTSTSSSCSGICTPNGGGVETLPTAGAGATGPGTGGGGTGGNGEGEEEGPDGSASAIDDCALPPPCDGDPFQCAILIQAHKDTCKLMQGPTVAETASMDAKIQESQLAAGSFIDANQALLDAQAGTILTKFQSKINGGSTGAANCLPDVPINAMGHTVIMEFSKACGSLTYLRYAVLACAYLMAASIIARAV